MIPAGHQDGSLQVALSARNYGFLADPLTTILEDYANGGGDWGAMNWRDNSMDNLEKVSQSVAPDVAHIQSAVEAVYLQKPVIPVAHYKQNIAVNERVRGFVFDPYERSYYLNQMTLVNVDD